MKIEQVTLDEVMNAMVTGTDEDCKYYTMSVRSCKLIPVENIPIGHLRKWGGEGIGFIKVTGVDWEELFSRNHKKYADQN